MASANSTRVRERAQALVDAAVELRRDNPNLQPQDALQCVCVALLVEQLDELEVALREAGGQS